MDCQVSRLQPAGTGLSSVRPVTLPASVSQLSHQPRPSIGPSTIGQPSLSVVPLPHAAFQPHPHPSPPFPSHAPPPQPMLFQHPPFQPMPQAQGFRPHFFAAPVPNAGPGQMQPWQSGLTDGPYHPMQQMLPGSGWVQPAFGNPGPYSMPAMQPPPVQASQPQQQHAAPHSGEASGQVKKGQGKRQRMKARVK